MPGTILNVLVKQGDTVKEGQNLLVLEAMKMENEVLAPVSGTVAQLCVAKGASVNTGDLLLVIG
jgi:biotin carboxyl carrier protein